MPNVREKEREARRKIIRQWAKLPKDKRQSIEGISEFARTAAQQNENAFVPQSSRSVSEDHGMAIAACSSLND